MKIKYKVSLPNLLPEDIKEEQLNMNESTFVKEISDIMESFSKLSWEYSTSDKSYSYMTNIFEKRIAQLP